MFDWLKSLRTKSSAVALTHSYIMSGFDNNLDIHNTRTYSSSLYLFIGVSMIAKRVAGVDYHLHRILNTEGETEEVFDHPALDLLGNPNERQTNREFMELSAAYYLLSGEAFWYMEPGNGGPVAMHTLRPDYTEVVMNPERTKVVAYEYQQGNARLRLDPETVLHFRNPNPDNPLRGIGVVRPASTRIATEQEASRYQEKFFKNQGRPDVLVFADRPIDNETSEEARADWKRTFGNNQGGNVGFFGNDIKDIKELNKTPKEMDFIASQNFLRDDILAALRIPKAMVTSDDVNLANAKVAKSVYLEEAVVPVLDAFFDVLNNQWLARQDEELMLVYDNPVPEDRAQLVSELKELTGEVYTQNEARQMVGLEAVEGGDALRDVTASPSLSLGSNAKQLQRQAKSYLRRRPVILAKLTAKRQFMETYQKGIARQRNSIFSSEQQRQGYAKAFNDRIDREADTLEIVLREFNAEQRDRVLAFNKDGVDPEMPFDRQEEIIAAKDKLTPVVVNLYEKAGQQALNDVAGKKSAENFFASDELKAAMAERAAFFIDQITETTFKDLQGTIRQGIKDGKSVDDVARDIKDVFAGYETSRLKTIARTETAFALSKATNDAYKQSTVVTGKEWITVEDNNVRPEHQRNHAKVVAKDGTFPSGEAYPGHKSVNCRCVLAAAF